MTNVQLFVAIGVPCFTMLITLAVSIWQSTQVLNQIGARFSSLERRMDVLEQDIKTLVRVTNDLAVRLARLEERIAR